MHNVSSARPIDHLVLPTASLDAARARLGALGFTVAPTGVHPFGTTNACVYLADGSFLEPLAVGDAAQAEAAAAAGNVFVRRDRLFRTKYGEEGFSALVFGTANAAADHAEFRHRGVSAGDMLSFSREFAGPDGRSDAASFKLAFAAAGFGDAFFVTCERVNAPAIDRSALQIHANGATRLSAVTATGDKPDGWFDLVASIVGVEADAGGSMEAANATVEYCNAMAFAERFGAAAPNGAFRLAAITFGVRRLSVTEAILHKYGVHYHLRAGRLIAPPAPGQGAIFAFEEHS